MPNCRYLIVRDGKIEHLLRLADGSASSLASSDKPLSLYEALVADAGFSVVHLDVAAVSAPSVAAQPVAAPARAGVVACLTRATSLPGKCQQCDRVRIRNGNMRGGAPRYSCPSQPQGTTLSGEKVRARRSRRASKSAAKRLGFKERNAGFLNNPKCPNCNKQMNVTGRHGGVTYYKCKNGCPRRQRGEGWSSLNLPSTDGQARNVEIIVRKRVESCNHHDPAIRDDVVQEIMLDLESQKLSINDLDNERIRGYIRSQQRLRSNPHRDISLDAPIGNSAQALSEIIEG
jgi:hypothetical protein